MAILGLTLNKVFYQKKRGSEHFSATLPRILKEWKFPVPHAPERMEVPSPTRPERAEAPGPTRPERMEAPGPTRPERAEAPSPGHRPGYVVCEPVALKGQKLSITRQKLYNITQPT